MPRKVDTWFDVVKLEHRVLEHWKTTQAFEKLREKNRDGEVWSFLDGPITANNPMGIHHAWGRTLKDAYQRYHAMNGRKLRWQNGFDCQGLWVEVEVEKQLGFATKRDIEAFGIDRFIELCKERVFKYSAIQTEQSIRLGYWMDWTDSYFTMSDENNYTIWTFLRKCHDRGLIYRGEDVMPWCARCGTGISQHEMHEGYKPVKDLSIFSRFAVAGREGEYFLVWTTTPWTLSSNTAIAVNPELTYAKVRQGDAIYYLSHALAKSVVGRKGAFEVLETMKGSAFEGWRYAGPYDELSMQQTDGGHPVIFWDAVAEQEGTGIVHIAPGCGKEDYELGKKFDLPRISPIDELGVFVEGFSYLTGKSAHQVAELVVDDLKKKGVLFATEKYEHSYPHCWRCGTALLFRAVDEWFIEMDSWREEIKDIARQIQWIPSYGLDLELDWLSNMRDWMISKKRYWGLALPIWVCEACDAFEVIGSKEELRARAVAGWEEFDGHTPHRPHVDKVEIACARCGGRSKRVPDVGNPWLDAGIVPYSTPLVPKDAPEKDRKTLYASDRAEWEKWIPADLVLECFPGQFRNWFYALLAMSTMMENKPPFKTLVGHALLRDETGEEMHKSAGNAIWFEDAAEAAGADVLRWVFCRHEPQTNLNFGYGAAKEARGKFINTYWNVYAFYANYARVAGYNPFVGDETTVADRPEFDRWILDRLAAATERARKGFESYNLRAGVMAAEEFVEELSNWYLRHNRRRFWGELTDAGVRAAFDTLFACVRDLTLLIAPVMPFMTEEVFGNIIAGEDKNAPVSVHHLAYPPLRPEWRDDALAQRMELLERATHLVLSARESAKQRVRQPLAKATLGPATEADARALEGAKAFLAENLNVKEIAIAKAGTPSPAQTIVKPNFRTLGKKLGPKMKAFADEVAQNGVAIAAKLPAEGTSAYEFDGESIELAREDFVIETTSPEDHHVAEEAGLWIMLDTRLTAELEREGLMRDILRRMQVMRKDEGLEIEDRCKVVYRTDDENAARAMSEFAEAIKEELLCVSLEAGEPGDGATEILAGGAKLAVSLTKA
ncbi:isoleucine--tRNA ligase [bacterium]|nr:isoleucine--tRNA ligase [bacterium]